MPTGQPRCDCCGLEKPARDWDYLYGMCGDCAWCHSLHEPLPNARTTDDEPFCHHGECRKDPV